MSWWYYAHGGRRWNWAKEPTFRCRFQRRARLAGALPDPRPEVVDAAKVLGTDAVLLQEMLERGHGSARRARVNGKLTDRCESCGRKMVRLGYRGWIDEENPDASAARVAGRLGFGPPRTTVPDSERYFDTKKQAQQWADEQSEAARSAAEGKTR